LPFIFIGKPCGQRITGLREEHEKEINDRLCEAFGLIVLVGNYGIGGFGSRGDDVAGLYLKCIQYESK
jgi:hypothetical protein